MGFDVLTRLDVMVLNKTINVCCSFLYVGASRRGREGVFCLRRSNDPGIKCLS